MKLDLQRMLFETKPKRLELIKYTSNLEKQYKVQVFRNHSFELVEHTISAYLDYAELGVAFTYGGYDDSFSFFELDNTADLIIVWIDMTRYMDGVVEYLLADRLKELRSKYTKPILVVPFGKDIGIDVHGIVVYKLDAISKELGNGFIDERAKAVTGTSLSREALMRISKELGTRYLPSLLLPNLKAIVVDLDNTLYSGVLGEDGPLSVVLTDGHKALQQYLKELSDKGFFLCVASKNDQSDVEQLFELRNDFPLKRDDFTIICSSWDPKSESMKKISSYLNIDPSSIVFVDDNIGELSAMEIALPSVHLIHASEDGLITRDILEYYPGLFKLSVTSDDFIRKNDVRANALRLQLKETSSHADYLKSLEMKICYAVNDLGQTVRVSELANKTNQFIFNYKRYTTQQIESMMSSRDYAIVTVSLSDRLSDSGIIGVCAGKKIEDYVAIEECFVSCRALGRGIDEVIVLGAIQGVLDYFRAKRAFVQYKQGPRNTPALKFIQSFLEEYTIQPASFSYVIPDDTINVERHGIIDERTDL